jgi:hypothetical protein
MTTRRVRSGGGRLLRAGLFASLLVGGAATLADAQVLGPDFPSRSYPTNDAKAVALGDVDGDGALDVVYMGHGPSVGILINDHEGGLIAGASPDTVPLGHDGVALALGDLDGDGDLDFAVPLTNEHGLAVGLGHGDGSFDPPVYVHPGNYMDGVVLADIDGDDVLDYIVCLSLLDALGVGLGLGDGSFAEQVTVPTGGDFPHRLVAGDLDDDGDVDLAVAHSVSDDVCVLLNDGAGGYSLVATVATVAAGEVPLDVELGDLDGDGDLDMLVVNGFPTPLAERIQLAYGNGDGTFAPPVFLSSTAGSQAGSDGAIADLDGDGDADLAFSSGNSLAFVLQDGSGFTGPPAFADAESGSDHLAVGDLSGDGFADVVLTSGDEQRATVILGDGGGAFVTPPTLYLSTGSVTELALTDMDADGHVDLVFVRGTVTGHTVSVMTGDGAGQLAAPIETGVLGNGDGSPNAIVVDDFDGDGRSDVVIVDSTGDKLNVLLGLGDGQFAPQLDQAAYFDPSGLLSGDLDHDGSRDLVVIHREWDKASVMLGAGDGSFSAPLVLDVGDDPAAAALTDLDGDGQLDLVTANNDSHDATVLLGLGDGAFAFVQTVPLDDHPYHLALTDTDGDGALDIVADLGDSVAVRAGLGDGTFATSGGLYAGSFEVAADVDLDGEVDLVERGFEVLPGDGQGGFGSAERYVVHSTGTVAVADFDEDGAPDVLIANSGKMLVFGRLDLAWIDLGQGLAGTLGAPLLHATGTPAAGQPVTLALSFARPGSVAALFVGLSAGSAPFKGGTLVPSPDLLVAGLPVDGAGTSTLAATWPAGVPAGLALYLQEWVVDPLGPAGFAASNAVRATAE